LSRGEKGFFKKYVITEKVRKKEIGQKNHFFKKKYSEN